MLIRQLSLAASLFFVVYLIQESVINQFRLPGGGFSILLIFTLVWAILSTPEIAALGGFLAGLLMDLSQSSSGPIGQWTLLMIAACYVAGYLGSGNEILAGNPLGFTFFTAAATFFIEIAYVVTGALLGVQAGSFGQVLITLLGISLWTLVVTPILLPIFSRLHELIFNTRSPL
ncbi:unannotated protein [freshwater metagenome]|uniref:Unannotated protein n=1 Tax=freshwater metagenome TaxID=449393 RepID=A0A6J6QX80_9ZZZZ|nr:rod shape-determining protein MreD [Actinomycetota bacterium]MSW62193.1 rod shape-determining protein MreD [Actinomycetota bacterium]MSX89272.1 rod shape-determining protein MreD [Actinomycetota bacterium]MSZ64294.1 rod shape-determining protein MreD [Actinomycetota bacterium]MTA58493.1 rod shape-determining protein MreD [Actinomycetota bacterium]